MNLPNPWLILAVLCLILTGSSVIYFKARSDGYKACKSEFSNELIKAEDNRGKIEKKVITSSDADLRRDFCEFVRDNKAECLQANIPISER